MQDCQISEKKGLMGFTLIDQSARRGFTLIELSIVLVIIGLIVGGVLVGQDLIKAAEVRATVGQYEKYNTAINTFRTKYNGMPGDLAIAQAAAFGMYSPAGMTGAAGLGDGNSLVEGASAGGVILSGETIIFWKHLTQANLVDGAYGADLAAIVPVTANSPQTYLPAAKLGRGSYFLVAATSGVNYYVLGGAPTIDTAGAVTYANTLTPIEAYNIDLKVDDGAPYTGGVYARGITTPFATYTTSQAVWSTATVASAASTDCIVGGATASTAASMQYARGTASGSNPNCMLRMRFN